MSDFFNTLREEHSDLFQTSDGSTYSPQKAITGIAAATDGVPGTLSSEVIDLTDEEPCNIIKIAIILGMAVSADGNSSTATLRVSLMTSDDNSTWTTISESKDYVVSELEAGTKLLQQYLPETTGRYVKVVLSNYGSTKFTAGSVFGKVAPIVD